MKDGHFPPNEIQSFVNVTLRFRLILFNQYRSHKLEYHIVRRQRGKLLQWSWSSGSDDDWGHSKKLCTLFTSSFSDSCASSRCRASTALERST